MARPLRIQYPYAVYHITSRGNERKKIYLDDSDRKKFLEILEDYHNRLGILTVLWLGSLLYLIPILSTDK